MQCVHVSTIHLCSCLTLPPTNTRSHLCSKENMAKTSRTRSELRAAQLELHATRSQANSLSEKNKEVRVENALLKVRRRRPPLRCGMMGKGVGGVLRGCFVTLGARCVCAVSCVDPAARPTLPDAAAGEGDGARACGPGGGAGERGEEALYSPLASHGGDLLALLAYPWSWSTSHQATAKSHSRAAELSPPPPPPPPPPPSKPRHHTQSSETLTP